MCLCTGVKVDEFNCFRVDAVVSPLFRHHCKLITHEIYKFNAQAHRRSECGKNEVKRRLELIGNCLEVCHAPDSPCNSCCIESNIVIRCHLNYNVRCSRDFVECWPIPVLTIFLSAKTGQRRLAARCMSTFSLMAQLTKSFYFAASRFLTDNQFVRLATPTPQPLLAVTNIFPINDLHDLRNWFGPAGQRSMRECALELVQKTHIIFESQSLNSLIECGTMPGEANA